MRKGQSFKSLGEISEIKLEAALADLAQILRAENELETKLRSLDSKVCTTDPNSQSLMSHVNNTRWLRWRHERKCKLNMQLATLKANKEMTISVARKALGRVQVIRSLESQRK